MKVNNIAGDILTFAGLVGMVVLAGIITVISLLQ